MKDWKASRDRKELLTLRGVIKSIWYNNTFAVNCQTISIWSKWQTACTLFDDYLFKRLQRVKVGDAYLSWQAVRRCVSQGSVLEPIFFNILFNDLLTWSEISHVYRWQAVEWLHGIAILSILTCACSTNYRTQMHAVQKIAWSSTLTSAMPWFWGLLIITSLLPPKTHLTSWEWISTISWTSINRSL